MLCKKCGKELLDTDLFCIACGTPVNGENAEPEAARFPAAEEPVVPANDEPVVQEAADAVAVTEPAAPRKKGKGLILAAVAAVAAVAVLVVLLVSGAFASDAQRLGMAIAKSGQAYAEAACAMPSEAAFMNSTQEQSLVMILGVEKMNGAEMLEGMGFRMNADLSLSQRHMGMSLVPVYGAVDLLNLHIQLKDNELYMGVPELTGDTYYMIHTDKLGQELSALGADMTGAEDLGINYFDQMRDTLDSSGEMAEATAEFRTALIAQLENIQVEKTGSGAIDVNGTEMKAACYHVLLPQQSVMAVVDALEEFYNTYNRMSAEIMDATMNIADEMQQDAEMFADLRGELEKLGDLEADLFVSDGYVVAAEFTVTADEDTTVAVRLALGGGENYVDKLSLTALDQNGEGIVVTSEGDHGAVGGEYRDTLNVEILEAGERTNVMNWDLRYAPADTEDNLSAVIQIEDGSISLNGQLTVAEEAFSLVLDEIAIREYGEELGVFSLEYSIGAYAPETVDVSNHMVLAEMTEADKNIALNTIVSNLIVWLGWLQNNASGLVSQIL